MIKRTGTTLIFLLLLMQPLALRAQEQPYGLSYHAADSEVTLLWYYPGVNQHTYSIEADEPDWYFIVADFDTDARIIVEFSGVAAQCALESAAIFLWGGDPFPDKPGGPTSPFGLSLYDHLPSSADDVPLFGEIIISAETVPPKGAWFDFPIRQIVESDGGLCLQMRWLPGFPTAPAFAVEYAVNTPSCHYAYLDGDQYVTNHLTGQNVLARLKYAVADTIEPAFPADALPDSFSLYVAADSVTVLDKTAALITISDSLHVSLSLSAVDSQYVSVAAWSNGTLSDKSVPIRVESTPLLPSPMIPQPDSLLVFTMTGGQSVHYFDLTNTIDEPVGYLIEFDTLAHSWLEIDSLHGWIDNLASASIRIGIDNDSLGIGHFEVPLMIAGFTSTSKYLPLDYKIINIVNTTTEADDQIDYLPDALRPYQNYPNPFNSATVILSQLAEPIHIHNILGRLVATLCPDHTIGDISVFTWDGTDLTGRTVGSGVYFYRQQGMSGSRKMLLLK